MPNLSSGYYTLPKDVNKAHIGNLEENTEGVISDLLPELELSMSDDELLDLKDDWLKAWSPFEKELAVSQRDNEDYWLGKQYIGSNTRAPVDNLIFEAVETFLPIATRPKADPVVTGNNTPEGQKLASNVRKMIQYWSDNNSFNLKLKQVVRYWTLYRLGVIKLAWSIQKNDVVPVAIRPQKLILDPEATIDSAEYTGEYLGEYRKDTARNLIKRYPKCKEYIKDQCKDQLGTKMQYIEWWTDDYTFWTMDDKVLGKTKNPHWNYEKEEEVTDEMGGVSIQKKAGRNHFKFPKKPYMMLSVFSVGMHPYDDTSLVGQNIPLQDLINKRLRQIDKNADKTNGSIAVSGDSFTKEQADNVARATEKGGTFFVPTGDVNRAIARISAPPLPSFVYESLLDYRNESRNIFGVRGSTAQGTIQDKTVRGKMQIKGQDSDRIGGGISTYLEQFADRVFNYYVQMMYVYYDQPHIATILGNGRAEEYIQLRSADLVSALTVTVKDGSMIPKDPVSEREEVLELWKMGAIDPKTFFEKLDFNDPNKTAEQLFLWKVNPTMLFPELNMPPTPPDPAKQAQAQKIQSQMQLEQMKGQGDLQMQKQKAEIEQQKGVEEILNAKELHELEMEKARLEMRIQAQKARQAMELSKESAKIKQSATKSTKGDSS